MSTFLTKNIPFWDSKKTCTGCWKCVSSLFLCGGGGMWKKCCPARNPGSHTKSWSFRYEKLRNSGDKTLTGGIAHNGEEFEKARIKPEHCSITLPWFWSQNTGVFYLLEETFLPFGFQKVVFSFWDVIFFSNFLFSKGKSTKKLSNSSNCRACGGP